MIKACFFIIIIFLVIPFSNVASQTFKQIDIFSNYIGKTFSQFENENKLIPTGKKKRFGLESRSYEFKSFFILVSEKDDEGGIGEIYYFVNEGKDTSEKWYALSNEMNSNSDYSFINAFIADPEDKITSNKLNYKELINILRNSIKTKDYIFEAVFQKSQNYTKISYSINYLNIITSSKPFSNK